MTKKSDPTVAKLSITGCMLRTKRGETPNVHEGEMCERKKG